LRMKESPRGEKLKGGRNGEGIRQKMPGRGEKTGKKRGETF